MPVIGDRTVSRIALGGAGWSLHELDEQRAAGAIRAAIDAGVTVIDTALAYTTVDHVSHNEALIARTIGDDPTVMVATKGGHFRIDAQSWGIDGRREAIRANCETSLATLGRESLDLYYLHWPDPDVPFEESVGALAELKAEGKIQRIGLSNVTLEQLDVALAITGVDAVENHLSPFNLENLPMAAACAEHGIAYFAYSPFGGRRRPANLGDAVPLAAQIGRAHAVSAHQVLLAWLLAGDVPVIPIVGAGSASSGADSAAAMNLQLKADELNGLTAALEEFRSSDGPSDH
jgi:aryl-alcohol dehydrogenase-like predicted oxidoreductase